MKRLAILFAIVPMFASAQNLEELLNKENLTSLGADLIRQAVSSKKNRDVLSKVNEELNMNQPALDLRGRSVLTRILRNDMQESISSLDDAWLLGDIRYTLTDSRVGASGAFDEKELEELTEYFNKVNKNPFVRPSTKFPKGKDGELEAPTVQLDVSVRFLRSPSEFRAFVGSGFRGGVNVDFTDNLSYVGKIYQIRPLRGGKAGNVVATYKVIGRGIAARRRSGEIWDRLFGAGADYEADSQALADANAADDSTNQILAVLAKKTREFHDRR
ncbi:MAG: hypothetical protein HZB70_03125 [Candidatus Berkelbacteria bacterium]|nr:MAG: hypothetical protein HZB70_03125 [Candidatus Berkelbacteria bacterium]QQG51706.1 MAG: hypothetical protein HY845_04065 [Candidatus Berkelbacteria bacterium]